LFLLASWMSITIAGSGSASTSASASGSGSISQRYWSEDPDLDPNPHQNVMDPLHCRTHSNIDQLATTLQKTPYITKDVLRYKRPPTLCKTAYFKISFRQNLLFYPT
jgi:hypothetical protein